MRTVVYINRVGGATLGCIGGSFFCRAKNGLLYNHGATGFYFTAIHGSSENGCTPGRFCGYISGTGVDRGNIGVTATPKNRFIGGICGTDSCSQSVCV